MDRFEMPCPFSEVRARSSTPWLGRARFIYKRNAIGTPQWVGRPHSTVLRGSNCDRQRAAHRALDKESEWTRAPPWRSKLFFASARGFAELSLSYAVQNNDGGGGE